MTATLNRPSSVFSKALPALPRAAAKPDAANRGDYDAPRYDEALRRAGLPRKGAEERR